MRDVVRRLAKLEAAAAARDQPPSRPASEALLPPELVAYLHHGPHAPPLSPEMQAAVDLSVAEYEAKRRRGRVL